MNVPFSKYHTTKHNTIQCYRLQYKVHNIQYNTVQYDTIQYNTIQYTILYVIIQYYNTQYNTQYTTWTMTQDNPTNSTHGLRLIWNQTHVCGGQSPGVTLTLHRP